jgi:hypothetical protein
MKSSLSKCLSVPTRVRQISPRCSFGLTLRSMWTHSLGCEESFVVGEELGSLGVVWQEEVYQYTNYNCGDTLEDETEAIVRTARDRHS